MTILKSTFAVLLLILTSLCQARLVQIIHTNDLHSYLTGYPDGRGGYPRVMTKIRELKKEAMEKGIEVLQVDAGDWGEGTSYFLSNNGSDAIKALEMLGAEVATIGNHDYLMGGNSLGQQIKASQTKIQFVLANLVQTPDMDLGGLLPPYVDLERAGIPIRIIGLTTDASYFQYSVSPGKMLDPVPIGEEQALMAKKAGRELVIALTHLGVNQDEALARRSSSIDVIIGGHSHTKLKTVDWVKNKTGRDVPIVQAWAHGLAVGSLLLNVTKEKGVEVVEYKLHEVESSVEQDPGMVNFVATLAGRRDENLRRPSDEVIGETKTPMTGYMDGHPVIRASCWGYHMATAARKVAKAQVGIHLATFEGVYKPPGPITYGDIASNFPHLRRFGDQGWEIATVFMSGWKLKPLMLWISRGNYGVTFSGLGYKTLPDHTRVMTIGGEEVDDKATYRIAFPAEVALAIKTSFPAYRKYLQGLKYTGKYYWAVMADYVKENSPIECSGWVIEESYPAASSFNFSNVSKSM